MMNFLLPTGREKAEKRVGIHSCFYCPKVFSNHRALGGHLRVHQAEIKLRRRLNYSGHSSNSAGLTRSNRNPASNRHPENSSVGSGSNLILSKSTASPSDFSRRFYSKESGLLNISKFSVTNLGNTNAQSILLPNILSGNCNAGIHHSNHLSSRAFAPLSSAAAMSSMAFSPSGSMAVADSPSDPSFSLGQNEVCQFNTDEFRTWRDGLPFSSGDAMQGIQHHNHGKLPYFEFAVTDANPGLGSSNQLPSFKESTYTVSSSLGPCQSPGQTKIGQFNSRSALTSVGIKRPYLDDAQGIMPNASKRPKFRHLPPLQPAKHLKKELPLFKDVEKSFSGLAISSVSEEEGQGDLDLSLHL